MVKFRNLTFLWTEDGFDIFALDAWYDGTETGKLWHRVYMLLLLGELNLHLCCLIVNWICRKNNLLVLHSPHEWNGTLNVAPRGGIPLATLTVDWLGLDINILAKYYCCLIYPGQLLWWTDRETQPHANCRNYSRLPMVYCHQIRVMIWLNIVASCAALLWPLPTRFLPRGWRMAKRLPMRRKWLEIIFRTVERNRAFAIQSGQGYSDRLPRYWDSHYQDETVSFL